MTVDLLYSQPSVLLECYSDKKDPQLSPATIVKNWESDKEVFYEIFLKSNPKVAVGSLSLSLNGREVLGLNNFTGDFFEKTRKVGRIGTELLQFAISRSNQIRLDAIPKSVLFYLNLGFRPVNDLIRKKKYGPDIFVFNRIRSKATFNKEQFEKVPHKIKQILAQEKGIDPSEIDYDYFLNNWWWNEDDQPVIEYSLTSRLVQLFAQDSVDFSKIPAVKMHLPNDSLKVWKDKIAGEITYHEFRKTLRLLE